MTITYTPQYRLTNLGSFTSVPSTTLTTATFTSLSAGTSYDFRVIADNGVGQSTSVPLTQITAGVSESAQNTSITQSNYTTTFIYDSTLNQWSLQTTNSFSIFEAPPPYTNPVAAGTSSTVALLLYWNHTVYQQNVAGNWWSWTGTTWNPTSNPRPTIISVNLSNSSFLQGSGNATVVGNITVTENSGNTFSGTLGVTGTNASFFTINASNQLVTVGNVPNGGPWSINIVATSNQFAVQNSPFTQSESISETVTSSGLVTANFSAINSAQPVVVSTVGGIGTSPYQGGTAYSMINNTSIQNVVKTLTIPLFRIHGGNRGIPGWSTTWPSAPAAGNTPTAFYNAANWTATGGWDQLFSGIKACYPQGLPKILLTGGGYDRGAYFMDFTTATGRTQFASSMAAIAQRAVFNNCEITYWEPMNEVNTKTGMTGAIYGQLHVAVAQAVKAYSVANGRPYYNVGGPCIDQTPSGPTSYIPGMVNACVAAGVPVDFIGYHDYMTGVPSSQGTTWQSYVQTALGRAGAAHTGLVQAQNASSTIPNNIPFSMTEYNMNWNWSGSAEAWQRDYHGAVWTAVFLFVMLTKQSGVNFSLPTVYELINNSTFGVISNPGSGYVCDPQGFFLTRLAQKMPGSQVTCTLNSSLTNCVGMATTNSGNFGLMLINYDWNSTTQNNVTIALNGYGGANATVWQCSSANPNGLTTVTTPGALASTGITLPAISVTIISQS